MNRQTVTVDNKGVLKFWKFKTGALLQKLGKLHGEKVTEEEVNVIITFSLGLAHIPISCCQGAHAVVRDS